MAVAGRPDPGRAVNVTTNVTPARTGGPAANPTGAPVDPLLAVATRIRHRVIDMCAAPHGGHLGGSMSVVDLLTVLYFAVLRADPLAPRSPDRDRFLLSKGHAAAALYATLAERGYLPVDELDTYATPGGRLMAHPVTAVPGVELPSGSLGHGLSLGLGLALAARLRGSPARVFVLLGDGELQEGSVWEAAGSAAANRAGNLVAIVDRNQLQLSGRTEDICPIEPLARRWQAFGWRTHEVDGHDIAALRTAFGWLAAPCDDPAVLIAHTVKGYGVPAAAGTVKSHFATLSPLGRQRVHRALDAFTTDPR